MNDAESTSFDIDEVSEADLQLPEFPHPPLDPSDMNLVLRTEHLLPPGVECKELESDTYALRIPGMSESARITTSPSIFDKHFESHQLFQPDAPLFRKMANLCQAEIGEEKLKEVGCLRDLL